MALEKTLVFIRNAGIIYDSRRTRFFEKPTRA
ncbi:MAG: 30S ribosomal protein S21 [Bdellovibrionales bacterium]|nr:30S ribosomal protein S21 [Bdellovibrionales bacterium]